MTEINFKNKNVKSNLDLTEFLYPLPKLIYFSWPPKCFCQLVINRTSYIKSIAFNCRYPLIDMLTSQ